MIVPSEWPLRHIGGPEWKRVMLAGFSEQERISYLGSRNVVENSEVLWMIPVEKTKSSRIVRKLVVCVEIVHPYLINWLITSKIEFKDSFCKTTPLNCLGIRANPRRQRKRKRIQCWTNSYLPRKRINPSAPYMSLIATPFKFSDATSASN